MRLLLRAIKRLLLALLVLATGGWVALAFAFQLPFGDRLTVAAIVVWALFVIAIAFAGKVIAGMYHRLVGRFCIVIKYEMRVAYQLAVFAQDKDRGIEVEAFAGAGVIGIPAEAYGKLRSVQVFALAFLQINCHS